VSSFYDARSGSGECRLGSLEIDDDQARVTLVGRDESLVDAGTAARRFRHPVGMRS